MGQYNAESGIKVLDRAVALIRACSNGPLSLNELCERTGLPRATVHRLATALEVHSLLTRTEEGHWALGSMMITGPSSLIEAAGPIMDELCTTTGESVQLYQPSGHTRTCIAAVEPPTGLHNVVPVGSQLTLQSGSAAKVILAHSPYSLVEELLDDATFDLPELEEVRRKGLSESVAEREVGLASLSAPITDGNGDLVAVLSISGPADRLRPSPAGVWGRELLDAARQLSTTL
ncbi:IclR family transcriptional regulator [Corynebacterium yudongzhengii]|uniref:IclR family transcriptional regulator n=1 Tax=Corynebacterium yudongzhengii TaxID=2080740 RepID=A0A2U1T975_9CORY|nr:IclR family transcriptional regulator [Corynebacterium yudongzhengii]AWB82039.1 IclR family transcriptional regulator [Corynebacterium yudongzhengii]PWC02543.1 IclR family transcriptional regulator [Corynebacterium yudongzhengii]